MLIECPECKRDISDKARTCPQCGYPIIGSGDPVEDYRIRRLKRSRIVCAIFTFVFTLWWLATLSNSGGSDSGSALICLILSVVGVVFSHMSIVSSES